MYLNGNSQIERAITESKNSKDNYDTLDKLKRELGASTIIFKM